MIHPYHQFIVAAVSKERVWSLIWMWLAKQRLFTNAQYGSAHYLTLQALFLCENL